MFFPLKFAVPLLMLLDLAAFLLFGARVRQAASATGRNRAGWFRSCLPAWRSDLTLLIEVAGTDSCSPCWARSCCSTRPRASRAARPAAALSRAWCAPIGLAGGAFSALFGTGGVLFAIYNAGRMPDKDALRATNAAMIMLSSLLRLLLFGAAGLLAQDGLPATALVLAAGAACARRLARQPAARRRCPRPRWSKRCTLCW